MDIYDVTKCLLVASLLALASATPLPYGYRPYPQTSGWDDSSANLLRDVEKLRALLGLQADDHYILRDPQPTSGQAMSKRFDFGFSGLDNIDHILTTLDRNEANRPNGRTLKQQFIGQDSRSHDIDKLKKLMQSVG